MGSRARTLMATVALVGGLVALSACSGPASWHGAGDTAGSGGGEAAKAAAVTIAAPADGATDIPTSTEIGLANAKPGSTVTITDASGATVAGAMRPDGQTWLPAAQLKYGTAYTATVAGE